MEAELQGDCFFDFHRDIGADTAFRRKDDVRHQEDHRDISAAVEEVR